MRTNTIRWGRLANVAVATWIITLSLMRLSRIWPVQGADLRLYLRGMTEWLHGGDPWSVHIGTLNFAAAPPSLLPMVPFALFPEDLAVILLTGLAVGATFWTLSQLGELDLAVPRRAARTGVWSMKYRMTLPT